MFTHSEIWSALDRLAETLSISPSRLARNAGLDPTSFNKSKRVSPSGKDRWPSTESLSKALDFADMSFEEFALLASPQSDRGISIPVIGLAQAGDQGFFDDAGYPVGLGWDDVRMPGHIDDNVYALEISGDSMEPLYRDGDRIIVAPGQTVKRGDRVVVKTVEGEVMAKQLLKINAKQVELKSINPDFADRVIRRQDVRWLARIIWVSQ